MTLRAMPRIVCALAVSYLALPDASRAQLVPIGGQIAVSQVDGDHEGYGSLAADRRGGWGAVWTWDDLEFEPRGSRARRFDRDGVPVPGTLHAHAAFSQPDLALDGVGDGVIVGVRESGDSFEIAGLCVDERGLARGPIFRVDSGQLGPFSPSHPRVAMAPGGDFAVAWEHPGSVSGFPGVFFRLFDASCQPLGPAVPVGGYDGLGRWAPHVAMRPGGGVALVWIERDESLTIISLRTQLFGADGVAEGPASEVAPGDPLPLDPATTVTDDGSFAIVWATTNGAEGYGVQARVYDATGVATSGVIPLRTSDVSAGSPSVAAIGERFVAVWGENGFVEEGSAVYARAFEAAGPLGPAVVANEEHTDPGNVRVAATGGAELVVLWDDLAEGTLPADIVARRFVLWTPGDVCVEDASTLCLDQERFRVSVAWRDYFGNRGVGRAVGMTADSGLFWFFAESNLEMLVKVLDACVPFERHWVYAAATTDVEYTLTVVDTATGRSRSYFNPLGTSSPAITDSDAFATCP